MDLNYYRAFIFGFAFVLSLLCFVIFELLEPQKITATESGKLPGLVKQLTTTADILPKTNGIINTCLKAC